MTQIVVSALTRTWTTRSADPTDPWDYGDTAGEVENVVALIVSDVHRYYGESHGKDIPDAKEGNTLYAVVVDYESGCTFGRAGGYAQVLDFFTDPQKAAELAARALAQKEKDGYGFEHDGENYYTSWLGYFESLNSIDVWECTVRKHYDPFNCSAGTLGYKVGR